MDLNRNESRVNLFTASMNPIDNPLLACRLRERKKEKVKRKGMLIVVEGRSIRHNIFVVIHEKTFFYERLYLVDNEINEERLERRVK